MGQADQERGPDGPGTGRAGAGSAAALGRHLRMLRKQRGWSQTALSGKSGVSAVTIRSIERNYPVRAGAATLRFLSRALGLPDDYLQGYRDNPPPEPPAGPEPPAAPGSETPAGRGLAAAPSDERWTPERVIALHAKMDLLEGRMNAMIDALVMTLIRIREM